MRLKYLAVATLMAWSWMAQASVVINATRVVYREDDGEAIVQVRNRGAGPVLMQVWIDDGDMNASPDSMDVPFSVMPSVTRVDADKGQAIRILQTRTGLPSDRESLLWLNVLEVPQKPVSALAQGENLLQFSLRSRIKLLYRPKKLGPPPQETLQHLTFSFDKRGGNAPQILVHNPTPYYVTFRSLMLRQSSDTPVLVELGQVRERVVAPMGELLLPLVFVSKQGRLPTDSKVFFTLINDYGGETHGEQRLSHDVAP
ncbi:molecular chaperone [Pseudomonas chlororaphis]|uniref:fimbrial biogenesis chaperone n=1 Tax=Pseudomonas chlororaphis TaxID=587753 RepID=UPI0023666EA4|nr:molecular chaperone [Pseudomonas chlororaphis]WDH19990.1 molecular chaperone [Pseudomonas chlororaphis]